MGTKTKKAKGARRSSSSSAAAKRQRCQVTLHTGEPVWLEGTVEECLELARARYGPRIKRVTPEEVLEQ